MKIAGARSVFSQLRWPPGKQFWKQRAGVMVQESGDVAYYSMEMVARLAGVSPARVRRLEQAGLLQPAKRSGNQALYGERELQRLRKIRRLTETLGVNLAGVAVILRLTDELAALREQLRAANTPGSGSERQ